MDATYVVTHQVLDSLVGPIHEAIPVSTKLVCGVWTTHAARARCSDASAQPEHNGVGQNDPVKANFYTRKILNVFVWLQNIHSLAPLLNKRKNQKMQFFE